MIGDIKKFSIAEMTSNDNGKTSGSGTMGILTIIGGLFAFLYATFFASALINSGITVIGIGAALLGVRKISKNQTDESDSKQ